MDERPPIRLDYPETPPARDKPLTTGMLLGVVLFLCGFALCLLLMLFVFRAR